MRRLLCAAACVLLSSAPVSAEPRTAATDHHVHVHSPAILAMLPGYCDSPQRARPCDPAFLKPLGVADLLADLDEAGVQRGWLMSTAYLAESALMGPVPADAPQRVQAANAFTVDAARAHPDRLSAFIGLNPLTHTALREITAWRSDPAAAGVKLHLTNSGVDLRDPQHVIQLKAVFRAAADAGFAIMIHMRTGAPDYGRRDAETFIREVLPEAGEAPVIVAHAAGWGGVDAQTLGALGAFADALATDPAVGRRLWFDMAQVYRPEVGAADRAALSALVRRIGPGRFLAASDWPFADDLGAYYARLGQEDSLTPEERAAVLTARVPLRPRTTTSAPQPPQ